MTVYPRAVFLLLALCFVALSPADNLGLTASQISEQTSFDKREDAYRTNNLGVAQLEQFNYKEAAEDFQQALSEYPSLNIARTNLAIALFNLQDPDAAKREAALAAAAMPGSPQPPYILGLIAKNQNSLDEALAYFGKVIAIDPQDVGSNVNSGQIYVQQRKYEEAVASFRRALAAEPYNSTALYNLATSLLRSNGRAEGQQLMTRFQALRQSGAATSIGSNYLEQGRYAEAVVSTGREKELVDIREPKISFVNAVAAFASQPGAGTTDDSSFQPEPGEQGSQIVRRFAAGTVLLDMENDGDLDLARVNRAGGITIYRNDRGRYSALVASGDLAKVSSTNTTAVVAGDLDNDGLSDLFVVGLEKLSIFRNVGGGRFVDVSDNAKLPIYPFLAVSCALVDVDHDGDLDIFIAGFADPNKPAVNGRYAPARNLLLRNNGDGTFTDISASAQISTESRNSVAVVPTDFDNRRDVDLMVLNYDSPPNLFRNLRNGSFEDVATRVGLGRKGRWTCAAAADVNKDSFTDFFFGRDDGVGVLALSDGRGNFVMTDAPPGTEGATSAQFLDYDNDGLVDIIANTPKGLVIARSLGDHWALPSKGPFEVRGNDISASRVLLSGDFDMDGDEDLFVQSGAGALHLFRNNGGNSNKSESVIVKGRNSNKTGIGVKVDLRSGSLIQKLETYSASPAPAPSDIQFGLGKRGRPDAVRIVWPSGVIQAETEFPKTSASSAASTIKIEELDRKPSSCPYLYAWNGEKFEFITDFLGGGEMGDWTAPGEFHFPDSDEFVRIPPGKLQAKDGRYELRVTNELEEVLFIDHMHLVAVEHDIGSEVYPNEGMGIPTAGQRILYTTHDERPPLSAVDSDNRNVLPQIEKLDREFYDSFKPLPIRGYAQEHSLTMTLDDKKNYAGRTLLLLTGWTDYAFSSDNVNASQSGKTLFLPKLQVKNTKGEWQTVIDEIGISIGRPQTVIADLTGKFLTDSREVRIVTNFQTYWDKVAVDTSVQSDVHKTDIEPAVAQLSERGFSREVPFGKMIAADYYEVVNDTRWKYFSGRFTKLGDVRPLLSAVDDVFVISKAGDEFTLSFTALPEPAAGKTYTFLLYADGYSKEMDINSGSPEAVFPLPFKLMKKYPYAGNEKFPMTEDKLRMYDEYTTRLVKSYLPRIETSLLGRP
jgi:tetratricopeptide (TPR) repeat protein